MILEEVSDVIEEFYDITGYDLRSYLEDALSFFQDERSVIEAYYRGEIDFIDYAVVEELDRLKTGYSTIITSINQWRHVFNNHLYWDLQLILEQTNNELQTIDNLAKWLRSSIATIKHSPTLRVEHVRKQGQTLENVALRIQGGVVDDWVQIAIENQLREEDYSPEGGELLYLQLKQNVVADTVTSVVDVINSAERIYGLDISRTLSFVNNDINVLSLKNTALQSVLILSTLFKGDCPEYPQYGLQGGIGENRNANAILFPVVFRQLSATFDTDDSFVNFALNDVRVEKDGIFYEFSVETTTAERLSTTLII